MNLLIIEDEPTQLVVYNDAIEDYNEKNKIKINSEICKNFEEGRVALLSPFFDAAIIDLKLSSGADLEGKKLIECVYGKIRIPIFVYSGSISQIDDLPENALFRKRLRTEKLEDIFKEILEIYNTGITSFLRPNGLIDRQLTEIFWKNLANDLGSWITDNNPNSLLRYILAYFQEYLEINVDGDFEEYHQKEIYLAPPIKKHPHTGDLIFVDDSFYLILTPACDIVLHYEKDKKGNFVLDEHGGKKTSRKSDKMILAKISEFNYSGLEKSKISDVVNNKLYRYHYLPPFNNDGGYVVDFQDLSSENYDIQYERIASISAPFIKDIISRFANYYSRQGQPTFNQANIVATLAEKASRKKAKP